jgi:hypothetical protein
MKTFIKIYKAMLLWATMFSITIFILGVDSMIEENRFTLVFVWLLINIIFVWMCKMQLTLKDVYMLSGTHWFERIIKEKRL